MHHPVGHFTTTECDEGIKAGFVVAAAEAITPRKACSTPSRLGPEFVGSLRQQELARVWQPEGCRHLPFVARNRGAFAFLGRRHALSAFLDKVIHVGA